MIRIHKHYNIAFKYHSTDLHTEEANKPIIFFPQNWQSPFFEECQQAAVFLSRAEHHFLDDYGCFRFRMAPFKKPRLYDEE